MARLMMQDREDRWQCPLRASRCFATGYVHGLFRAEGQHQGAHCQPPRLDVSAAPGDTAMEQSTDLSAVEAGEAGGGGGLFAGGLVSRLPLRLPGQALFVLDLGLAEGLRHLWRRRLLLGLVPLRWAGATAS